MTMTLLKKLLAVPAEAAGQFFLSTLLYTDQPTQKTAPPPVAFLPFQLLPFQRSAEGDSPLPFPDWGIGLMWISISQINVTQSRPLARMKG